MFAHLTLKLQTRRKNICLHKYDDITAFFKLNSSVRMELGA